MANKALIVGVSGVIGNALWERLLGQGWSVHGLSRGRTAVASECIPLVADLTTQSATASAGACTGPTPSSASRSATR